MKAFVVMPFAEFEDVFELGIKQACIDAGLECVRVDKQIFLSPIPEMIKQNFQEADLVLAEVTKANVNVYYEVGYAHGMGKPVFLMTADPDNTSFDLRHYQHIVYGGAIRMLKENLTELLKTFKGNPNAFKGAAAPNLDPKITQILNYLKANNYSRISFERLRSVMGYTEEESRKLVESHPELFRFALLKGERPGLALCDYNSDDDHR